MVVGSVTSSRSARVEAASGEVSSFARSYETVLTTGGGGWKKREIEERQGGGGQWGGESRLGETSRNGSPNSELTTGGGGWKRDAEAETE